MEMETIISASSPSNVDRQEIPIIIQNKRLPFNFDRENPEDYSLEEKKTLEYLGKDRLDCGNDWRTERSS